MPAIRLPVLPQFRLCLEHGGVIRAAAVALALLAFVAAPASAQGVTTAETGHFTGADRTARLVAGAKKEGTLALYSSAQVEVMTAALADPTVWLQREVLHACWGRRPAP